MGLRDYIGRLGDVELLQRTRKGDEVAFAQLFTRYQSAIYRDAAYMCGRDAADDIVQETFLAVLQQKMRHDTPQGAVIWSNRMTLSARSSVLWRAVATLMIVAAARGAAQTIDFLGNEAAIGPIVRGTPYSGEGVTLTQTLGDGTRIERALTARF
jgi:hypothetical protein